MFCATNRPIRLNTGPSVIFATRGLEDGLTYWSMRIRVQDAVTVCCCLVGHERSISRTVPYAESVTDHTYTSGDT